MKIKIKNGRVVQFDVNGNVIEQMRDLEALLAYVRKIADNMDIVVQKVYMGKNQSILIENEQLRRKVRNAENTLNIADKQLKERNGK